METSGSVELDASTDTIVPPASISAPLDTSAKSFQSSKDSDASSSQARRRGFFRRNSRTSVHSSGESSGSITLRGDERDTQQLPLHQERDAYVRQFCLHLRLFGTLPLFSNPSKAPISVINQKYEG